MLEQYGGEIRQGGHGMYFNRVYSDLLSFETFLQKLTLQFFEFQQILRYIRTLRDDLKTLIEQDTDRIQLLSKEDFQEADVETLCNALLPLFYPFPPLQPWLNTQMWEDFLTELQLFFTWKEIDDITNTFLNNLEMIQNYTDKDEIIIALRDGLRKGLRY